MSKQPIAMNSSRASQQPNEPSVCLLYDGQSLILSAGSDLFSYGISGALSSTKIDKGYYTIKAEEIVIKSWLTPSLHLSNCRMINGDWSSGWEEYIASGEMMCLKLHARGDSSTGVGNLYLFGYQTVRYSSAQIPLSPFSEMAANLKLAADLRGQKEILVKISNSLSNQQERTGVHFDRLKGHVPDTVLSQLETYAEQMEITSDLRLAHFLAQTAAESGGFKRTTENLSYSAKRLPKVFSRFRSNPQLAPDYAHKPEKLGNYVYSSRMGNGDAASGDGYKYRGRGFIQLTGKNNYRAFSEFMKNPDILKRPELVATEYPLVSAGFYFQENHLWTICDKGSSSDVIKALTKRINGGLNGLSERITYFNKYHSLLNGS